MQQSTSIFNQMNLPVSLITIFLGTTVYSSLACAQQLPISERQPQQQIISIPQEDYLLGAGDSLRIDVFNATDYSGEFPVLAGGMLNLPLVGSIPVGGLTLGQASTEIESQLAEYVRRPRVTISLLAARPLQVAIAGEVNRPGAYTIPLDGELGIPTLTQVVDLAGGITQIADIRKIQVQRQRSTSSRTNHDETLSVDLMKLLREGHLEEDIPLQDGDRILIPEAMALSPEETTELATASFSPDEMTVNIVGEVTSPGTIQVPPNTPLNQAILAAGGFNNRAQQGTVNLVRLNANGTVTQQDISVDFAVGVNETQNPPLRPNDTVIVNRSGLTRVTDTLGSIFSPLGGVFNLFRLLGDL